jgi:hypothetical protein
MAEMSALGPRYSSCKEHVVPIADMSMDKADPEPPVEGDGGKAAATGGDTAVTDEAAADTGAVSGVGTVLAGTVATVPLGMDGSLTVVAVVAAAVAVPASVVAVAVAAEIGIDIVVLGTESVAAGMAAVVTVAVIQATAGVALMLTSVLFCKASSLVACSME